MASSYDAGHTWMAPGSPSKTTLQRGNATARQSRDASPSSPRKGGGGDFQQASRSRQMTSPASPGKENFPILGENRGRTEARPTKLSFFRGKSPERRGQTHANNLEVKARSVSPMKRDRNQFREDDRGLQCDRQSLVLRSSKEIDTDFVNMLSEMEVPSALRQKLMTMEPKVKESMMKGQATLSLASLSAATLSKSRLPISEKFRKSKSSGTVKDEGGWGVDDEMLPPDPSVTFGACQSRATSGASNSSDSSDEVKTSRKTSLLSTSLNSSSPNLPNYGPRSRSGSFSSVGFGGASGGNASAASFATMLKTTDTSRLDVAQVKKMRAVLSSESPVWIGEFVEEGGYSAMVTRLKELLSLEWREEQHDDQLLHELLRCFIALSTTDRGRTTLQGMLPTPFVELSDLLYSEKRPGDLSTRKLLVELLTLLSELPMTSPESNMEAVRKDRESSTVLSAIKGTPGNVDLLCILLHNLRDPIEEAKVDFITASHASRPFKTFVSELLNINRDYFWVFCHSNRFWALQEINVDQVECPKVPGGMTGGVEFEAMGYLTSLFRLLNTVCSHILKLSKRNGYSSHISYDFHSLLFSSGLERALAVTRKASQTYYQSLHLELARYFDHARQSKFQLPLELEAWQSNPRLLQTTEYRYFNSSPFVGESSSSPTKSRSASPEKRAERATPSVAPTLATTEKGKVVEGALNGNTGKWLGGNKQSSRDAALQFEKIEADAGMLAFGPRLPNPHMDITSQEGKKKSEEAKSGQVPPASMVGTAVQRWEQLTAKHQGDLGIGWAPSR